MNNLLSKGRISEAVLKLQNQKKTTAYVYIILSLISVSFFGLFAIRPAFSIIANLQKAYADNKLVLDALEKKLANIKSLDSEYTVIEPNLDVIHQAIPEAPEAPTLIRQIEILASQNNIQINSFSTEKIESQPDKKNEVQSFNFSLDAVGPEENMSKFLNKLISFNRIVTIENISNIKPEPGNANLSITGKAYFKEAP